VECVVRVWGGEGEGRGPAGRAGKRRLQRSPSPSPAPTLRYARLSEAQTANARNDRQQGPEVGVSPVCFLSRSFLFAITLHDRGVGDALFSPAVWLQRFVQASWQICEPAHACRPPEGFFLSLAPPPYDTIAAVVLGHSRGLGSCMQCNAQTVQCNMSTMPYTSIIWFSCCTCIMMTESKVSASFTPYP
jgi:hypothetical protein